MRRDGKLQLLLHDFLRERRPPAGGLPERAPDDVPVVGEQVDHVRQLSDALDHLHDRADVIRAEPVDVVDQNEISLSAVAQFVAEVLVRLLQGRVLPYLRPSVHLQYWLP